MTSYPLLEVDGLRVALQRRGTAPTLLDGLSFAVAAGQCLGIVGESGCGKSLTLRATMGLLPAGVERTGGQIRLSHQADAAPTAVPAGQAAGRGLAMVFQDSHASLDPTTRVGAFVTDIVRRRTGASRAAARRRAVELLAAVGVPDPALRFHSYPHELSGGMRQRVAIALALATDPRVLLCDEPTTALDVTLQAEILLLLDAARAERGLGMVFVSHDIAVIRQIADVVAVMYAGQIIEAGPVADVLDRPRHPYTRALIDAVPTLEGPIGRFRPIAGAPARPGRLHPLLPLQGSLRPPGRGLLGRRARHRRARRRAPIGLHPLLLRPLAQRPLALRPRAGGHMSALIRVHSLVVDHPVRAGFLRRRRLRAVDGVDLELGRGEILGLVGESGCGKSTLARAIVGLATPTAGGVLLDGAPVPRRRPPGMRRRIQMIYQDPGSSLDPRRTVSQTLAEPLRRTVPAEKIAHRARELLEMVGLGERQAHALPRELSGGQRQRVAIARALAVEPEVLVADEAVAALDASVAGAVLNLLSDLRERLGLSVLFISHDLATVRGLCDRVAVMYLGSIVEEGPVARVFARPGHPYTRVLLDAVPSRDRRRSGTAGPGPGGLGGVGGVGRLGGEPPSPLDVPPGCRFHPRCPRAAARCGTSEPSEERRDGQRVWCHFAWRHEL